jgi:hypothetical protein
MIWNRYTLCRRRLQWKCDDKGCSCIKTWTFRANGAAMEFNKVFDKGEAKAETAIPPGTRTVFLPEAIAAHWR